MKKLLLLCGFVFSMTSIFAQAETQIETPTETQSVTKADTKTANLPTYKNALSGSLLFRSGDMGVSVDYRRRFGEKNELILGFDRSSSGNDNTIFGYRRYFLQKGKFSMAIGLNARLRNVVFTGGGLGLTGFPRVQRTSIQGVMAAYYMASDRIQIMAETRLAPVFSIFNTNQGRTTKVGIKYIF